MCSLLAVRSSENLSRRTDNRCPTGRRQKKSSEWSARSPSTNAKALLKPEKRLAKERREEQEFRDQFANGFTFRLVGEEPVAGRPCYRIHAEPKPGFPMKGDAKILSKLKGDLWIDKEQLQLGASGSRNYRYHHGTRRIAPAFAKVRR